ncbi:LysR substrate-binding domain-containing protein [Roseiarcus sp.]|uniref:LysR family transcriptional regulator n=1 Tax=Roseiarcus sp. TaxID=1969460 RepID=UPI003F9815BE
MDQLAALRAFVAVAEAQSFSNAARALRIAKSAVSRQVSDLETDLGARLLHRTTRSLSLTEAGRAYFERATRILADLDDANRAVGELQAAPRGRLRISAPMSFGFLHLMPALSDFMARYPDVVVDLAMNDRFVDLVNEGFDVAIRIASLPDSSLIARRLAPARRVICASPSYLSAHGAPRSPNDLKTHVCLFNSNLPSAREWRFVSPDGAPLPVTVNGRLSVNNGDALRVAALRGQGLANLPTFIVGADLQSGALATVLDSFVAQDLSISAVYPHSRHLSPTVRALIDFLVERFGPEPYWDLVC